MNIERMASKIYTEVYGAIDDKYFRATKTQEIADWLADGDTSDTPSLETLVEEWREFDADDIEERIATAETSAAAATLGRIGGSRSTPAKTAAARANANKPPAPGKKRGRPKKSTN